MERGGGEWSEGWGDEERWWRMRARDGGMERGCVEWSEGWGNGERLCRMERGMGEWREVV